MAVIQDGDTERLLTSAAAGDDSARAELLQRHRERLRQAIARRMDRRLSARIDASDVIQEALADADRKFPRYLRERPIPFYPWLRRLALERLIRLYRRHVEAEKRSVTREVHASADPRAAALSEPVGGSEPIGTLARAELSERVRTALNQLAEVDREVIQLRHFDRCSVRETALRLGLAEGTVKVRYLRALRRFRDQLAQDPEVTSA